jgi:phage terminase Nu1 subunit (DNA packaging protein)
MSQTTLASQLVRKRQLAALLSVSPRTIDGWVSKRMIPFIEPNARLHLFDPAAVKSALMAQFAVPANIPEDVGRRAELQVTGAS